MKTTGDSGSYFTYLKTRLPKFQEFRPLTPVKDLKIQWPTKRTTAINCFNEIRDERNRLNTIILYTALTLRTQVI